MEDKGLWKAFEKTGSVVDYLSYKGVHQSAVVDDIVVGEKKVEPKNNSNGASVIRDTYR